MDAAISLDSVVVASGDPVSCRLEEEVGIVHMKAGVYWLERDGRVRIGGPVEPRYVPMPALDARQ